MTDLDLYRPNVGVVLFDREGRVWIGRRRGAPEPFAWQFPQGGVDPGEDWEAAAFRELHEETGVRSATVLGRTDDWIIYDFPPEARGRKVLQGFKGQRQKWFAMRFLGVDTEIDLHAHEPPEFEAWRWARLDEVEALVVPFKREAYRVVVTAFRSFAGG